MSEDTKQLTSQTGLLTQIAESIRSLNTSISDTTSSEMQADAIGDLKDTIEDTNQDQTNQRQEQSRQEKTQSFKERLQNNKLFGSLSNTFTKVGESIKGTFGKLVSPLTSAIGGTIAKLGLAQIGLIAFLSAAIAFMNSPLWDKTVELLQGSLPGIIETFIGFFKKIRDAFLDINVSFSNLLADPSLQNLKDFFGDAGFIALGILSLIALLNPFRTLALGATFGLGIFGTLKKGITGALGKTGYIAKFTKLFAKGGFLALQFGRISAAIAGIGLSIGGLLGITATGATASAIAAGIAPKPTFASKAFKAFKPALKVAGPIALISTAIFGLFDATTAALEKASDPEATGLDVFNSAMGGLFSSLTFNLIKKDTIVSALESFEKGIMNVFDSIKNFDFGSLVPDFLKPTVDRPEITESFAINAQKLLDNLEFTDIEQLQDKLNIRRIQEDQKFAVLKSDLEEAVRSLEQRQNLLDDIDRQMQTNAAAFTVDAKQSTVNNTTHTNKPIVGMDLLTSMAVAARSPS